MSRALAITAALALSLGAWSELASADAIPPEPEECPPGTFARSDHGGARCEPSLCGRDVSPPGSIVCERDTTCRDALIRFDVQAPLDYVRPGFPTVAAFEGECDCPRELCQRADVCVPDTLPVTRCAGVTRPRQDGTAPPPRGGCASCAVSSRAPAAVWTASLLALVLASRRSRSTDQ